MKRRVAAALAALAVLSAGCGTRREPVPPEASASGPERPETVALEVLRVELPRGVDARAARAALAALPEKTAPLGLELGAVELTFGASSSATVQSLADGNVDLAFLPAADFVRLDREAAATVGGDGSSNDGYGFSVIRALPVLGGDGAAAAVCAGPSEYGASLADLSARRTVTWTELDHARWGVLDRDSQTGYRCLELWLEDRYGGNGVGDLTNVAVYDGWVELLEAAAAEEIDCFPLPEDWESSYGELWTTAADRFDGGGRRGLGRTASMGEEVRVLAGTERLFTAVAAASPQNEKLGTETFRTALAEALADSFDGPAEALAALGAGSFTPIGTGDLDSLRRLEFGT